MIVTPLHEHGLILAANEPGFVRSSGVHLSTIYNDLYEKLEPNRFGKWKGDGGMKTFDFVRMELGMCFEGVLEDRLKRRLADGVGALRPESFVTDEGIHFSPDLFVFTELDETILGEIKLTWMSCRGLPTTPTNHLPEKFDKWLTQIKGYCYKLGLRKCRLYVYFVCGDYSDKSPKLLAFDLEFTAQELHDNWRMLMTHGRDMGVI